MIECLCDGAPKTQSRVPPSALCLPTRHSGDPGSSPCRVLACRSLPWRARAAPGPSVECACGGELDGGDGAVSGRIALAVDAPRGVQHQQPGLVDLDTRQRDPVLDVGEIGDPRAERTAFERQLDWSGRCWPETASSDLTTRPLSRSHSQVGLDSRSQPTRTAGDHTTDCSGDHEMMAKQVRPWLTKPAKCHAPRVHTSDGASTSEFHQGQRARLAIKVRMHGCNRRLQVIIN